MCSLYVTLQLQLSKANEDVVIKQKEAEIYEEHLAKQDREIFTLSESLIWHQSEMERLERELSSAKKKSKDKHHLLDLEIVISELRTKLAEAEEEKQALLLNKEVKLQEAKNLQLQALQLRRLIVSGI